MRWIALLCLSLPVPAQFNSFVTTYDGARLYFTSRLAQPGTSQPSHGKIFVADDGGVRPLLIRNRDRTYYDLGPGVYWTSNYYDVFGVELPGDVSSLAAIARRECQVSTGICGYSDQTETIVYNWRGEEAAKLTGRLRLSPDGKWGIVTSGRNEVRPFQYVIELASGTKYPFKSEPYGNPYAAPAYQAPFDWGAHDIANNGTAVVAGNAGLLIFRPPDQVQRLSGRADSAVIDAPGRRVVWADGEGQARGLRLLDLASNAAPVLLDAAGRDEFAPNISNDGNRVLFLSRRMDTGDAQAFVMRSDGSGRRQITSEAEGIQSAVLSGNGAVAWVLTRMGRVIRIEVDGGARREVIGHVAAFLGEAQVWGGAGAVLKRSASVAAGEAVEVEIGGRPAPVVNVEQGAVTFQVPWELEPYDTYPAGLRKAPPGEWAGTPLELFAVRFQAAFVQAGSLYALAAHEDWSALVDTNRPARPGEIIHIYATGLGPVMPPVPTGATAPDSPLSLLATPLHCYVPYGGGAGGLDVLYAGLAPRTIGYYLISVRLPPAPSQRLLPVECEVKSNMGEGGTFGAYIPMRDQ